MHVAQATYFDQNFSSTFFLDPEEAGLTASPAPASASKGLQRLKRTPQPLPAAQPARDIAASDRAVRYAENDSPAQCAVRDSTPNVDRQQLMQAILDPHDHAGDQQHEQGQAQQPGGAEAQGAHLQSNAEQGKGDQELPAFSLDRYFAPLKQPAFRSADQQQQGSANKHAEALLPYASPSRREIEDELLMTIEEQDQTIRYNSLDAATFHHGLMILFAAWVWLIFLQ